MQMVRNSQMVEQACAHFIKPHPCLYNVHCQLLPLLKPYPHLTYTPLELQPTTTTPTTTATTTSNLKLHLVHNSYTAQSSQSVVIYLHGLSSYALQGKFLVQLLAGQSSICMYDSRGHGKNKAEIVTYGLLEAIQLKQVVAKLRQKGYNHIILWGRSMGAVTALHYLNTFPTQPIKYLIADAPFSSFKSIATDIVSKITHLPSLLAGILAQAFADKIKERFKVDLRELDLGKMRIGVPVHFMYSGEDQLMGEKQIENILQGFEGEYQKDQIGVTHNEERPTWVINKLIANIRDKLKDKPSALCMSQIKRRGLTITKYYQNNKLILCKSPPPMSSYNSTEQHQSRLPPKNTKINLSCCPKSFRKVHTMKQNKPGIRFSQARNNDHVFELGGSKVRMGTSRVEGLKKEKRRISIGKFFENQYM